MAETPLISVITCTYNAVTTLSRTLNSVASQSYACLEHVIIDGCSNDGTFSLIQRYVEQEHPYPIRVVREPDDGLYDAMNKGVRQCAGDYVVFLNAGDTFHEDKTLDAVVSCMDWGKGDFRSTAVCYGETDIVDEKGRFLRHRRLRTPQRLTWKSFQQGMLVCHQSFYVRRDIAASVCYDMQYRFSADVDWCIRVLKIVERRHLQVVNVQRTLTDYLSAGMTTQHHMASLRERWQVMRKHYGLFTTIVMHVWFLLRAVYLR